MRASNWVYFSSSFLNDTTIYKFKKKSPVLGQSHVMHILRREKFRVPHYINITTLMNKQTAVSTTCKKKGLGSNKKNVIRTRLMYNIHVKLTLKQVQSPSKSLRPSRSQPLRCRQYSILIRSPSK